jgi:hypothetical protein
MKGRGREMYCEKCGAKLNEGAKFCVMCGAPVSVMAQAGVNATGAKEASPKQNLSRPKIKLEMEESIPSKKQFEKKEIEEDDRIKKEIKLREGFGQNIKKKKEEKPVLSESQKEENILNSIILIYLILLILFSF